MIPTYCFAGNEVGDIEIQPASVGITARSGRFDEGINLPNIELVLRSRRHRLRAQPCIVPGIDSGQWWIALAAGDQTLRYLREFSQISG